MDKSVFQPSKKKLSKKTSKKTSLPSASNWSLDKILLCRGWGLMTKYPQNNLCFGPQRSSCNVSILNLNPNQSQTQTTWDHQAHPPTRRPLLNFKWRCLYPAGSLSKSPPLEPEIYDQFVNRQILPSDTK